MTDRTASITKPHGPIGIRMESQRGAGHATITGFSPTSILKDSAIQPGDKLVSVNGVLVKSADHAKELIAKIPPGQNLTLVSRDPNAPEPVAAPPAPAPAPPPPAEEEKTPEEPAAPSGDGKHYASIIRPTGPLGLKLECRSPGAPTMILEIGPNSPLRPCDIAAGQQLLEVNGSAISSPDGATSLIRQIPAGSEIALTTRDLFTGSISKPTGSVGIRLTGTTGGPVIISGFAYSSEFNNTDLKAGHQLLTVNDRPVTTATSATDLIKAVPAGQKLTLLTCLNDSPIPAAAAPPAPTPAPVDPPVAPEGGTVPLDITTEITKPNGPVGLRMEAETGGPTIIADISTTSPILQMTAAVKPGQQLVSVNGVPVQSPDHAKELIGGTAAGATMTIVTRQLYTAKVTKPVGAVGIRLKGAGYVQITSFTVSSPLNATDMKVGQIVLTINGERCSTAAHATDIIKKTPSSSELVFVYCDSKDGPPPTPVPDAAPPVAAAAASAAVAGAVTATVLKPEGPLGISFKGAGEGRPVKISGLKNEELLASDVAVGHQLLSVNGTDVTSPDHAKECIAKVPAGFRITLVTMPLAAGAAAAAAGMTRSIGTTGVPPKGAADEILKNPYPIPTLYKVRIKKPDGPVGITMKSPKSGPPARITGLSDTSPFQETEIKTGQVVLAINRVGVTTAEHGLQLIQKVPAGSGLEIVTCDEMLHPYYKMVVATPDPKHPGVRFTSTRGNCFARVSRIFPDGPLYRSQLARDDLILAVNGVAVSDHDHAEKALLKCIQDPMMFLYAVDVEAVRKGIMVRLKTDGNFVVKEEAYNSYDLFCGGKWQFGMEYNLETQRLRAHQFSTDQYHTLDEQTIPFLTAFNTAMEAQMTMLEEAVACEVWAQDVKTATSKAKDEEIDKVASGDMASDTATDEAVGTPAEDDSFKAMVSSVTGGVAE